MKNVSIINKLRILGVVIILAIGHIVAFQVIWVTQTYERSKKAISGNLQNDLEMMVGQYKKETADTIRLLLKEIIQSSPSFNYVIFDGARGRTIGYRYANYAYVRFKVNGPKASFSKEEAYKILQNEIKNAPLEELSAIYSSLIGTRDFNNNTQASLARQLMLLVNEPYADMVLLNKIVKRTYENQSEKFYGRATYLKDIDELNKNVKRSTPSISIAKADVQEEIAEVIATNELPLDEKLNQIDLQINHLNANGDSVYVAKPLFDNVEDIKGEIPVILLAVKLPSTFALTTMLNLAISLSLLMLFLGGCIIYMFFLILKQKKLSEIKDDFISNVSHELKTPVATTLAAVQGMQHFGVLEDKDKTNKYLATAAKEMYRLSIMIDTILNSAVYDRSDFNLNVVKFNFKEMLIEMINVQELYAKKEVKINLNYQIDEEILADKTHLYTVFLNLIENAIKYGNEMVIIKIECVNNEDGIKILVSDNGNGIPLVYQKNIFDKFFRVPSPNDHAVKGYGLGLNYVKNIIEKHKGTIILSKSGPSGSSFEINLPQ